MALGFDRDTLARNWREARIFGQMARGNVPAGFTDVFGRPFAWHQPVQQPPPFPSPTYAPQDWYPPYPVQAPLPQLQPVPSPQPYQEFESIDLQAMAMRQRFALINDIRRKRGW
jgi:hypothetical protein